MSVPEIQTQAEQALKAVMASMPAEGEKLGAYIGALHRKSVVALGEDEAFALADKSGTIKAFKQRLILSAGNGGLVQPVYNGPFVVSAQGYEMWAEAAGACVIFPKTVMVDGVEQANPHVIRDPNNRRILNIYARAVAFRFSSKGIPMVADWTTAYDVPSYRLIDLIAKANKFQQAFKLLPSEIGAPEGDGTWACYPFDESTNLWVDTSHKEALDWYKTILNREKKAMDFAQTFARRNACKHLSGLQKSPSGESWEIPIICWRPTGGSLVKWDSTTYANVQRRIEGLGEGQDFASLPEGEKPMAIQYNKGAERMDDEQDMIGAEDEEREPEQAPAEAAAPIDMAQGENGTYGHAHEDVPEPEPEPEKDAVPAPDTQAVGVESAKAVFELTDEDKKALANYEEVRANFPDEDRKARLRMSLASNLTVRRSKIDLPAGTMADKQAEIDQIEAELAQARADLETERIEAAKIEAQAEAEARQTRQAPPAEAVIPVTAGTPLYCAPATPASPDMAAILERILATMDRAGCDVCAARMVIKSELIKARKGLDRRVAA